MKSQWFAILILLSCNNRAVEEIESFDLGLQSGEKIHREIITNEIKNSIHYLEYNWFIKNKEYKQILELPLDGKKLHQFKNEKDRNIHITLMDSLDVQAEEDTYTIYKYLYDDPMAIDEEQYLYSNIHLGLIKQSSKNWGAYRQVQRSPLIMQTVLEHIKIKIDSSLN